MFWMMVHGSKSSHSSLAKTKWAQLGCAQVIIFTRVQKKSGLPLEYNSCCYELHDHFWSTVPPRLQNSGILDYRQRWEFQTSSCKSPVIDAYCVAIMCDLDRTLHPIHRLIKIHCSTRLASYLLKILSQQTQKANVHLRVVMAKEWSSGWKGRLFKDLEQRVKNGNSRQTGFVKINCCFF